MPATNLTNLLKVFGENTTNLQEDATYAGSNDRLIGFQPNTIISSRLTNTALRQSTLISSALVQAIKEVSLDLATAKTIGGSTTFTEAVNTLKEAILKIKVDRAALADNVVGGAIVEETTTAREFKPGYGISQSIKRQARLKETWIGTHVNGDMIYYNDTEAIPTLKGWYIVYGLSEEYILSNTFVPAQTLVITSGQTPTTHAANLKRLTVETAIGSNVNLSKTDTVSSSSTTNQLSSAKAVFDYAQVKIPAGTTNDILTRTSTAGVLGTLTKVTSFDYLSTDNQIPTAKSVADYAESVAYLIQEKQDKLPTGTNKIVTLTGTQGVTGTLDKVIAMPATPTDSQIPTAKLLKTHVEEYVESKKWTLVRDTTAWTTISNLFSNSTPTLISCNSSFIVGDVLAFELAISGYTDRPFIVQSVLTLSSTNPDSGNIFKAEGLTTYGQGYGAVNVYKEVRHYIKFSFSEGTNLRFKTAGSYGEAAQYPSASPLAINYKKDDYDNTIQNVTSEIGTGHLQVRRIWRIR